MGKMLLLLFCLFSYLSFSDDTDLYQLAENHEKITEDLLSERLHSLDTFRILDQNVIVGDKQRKFSDIINVNQIEVNVFKDNGQSETLITRELPMLSSRGNIEKIVLSFQGRNFHEFTLSASEVITFNQMILIKTKRSFYYLDLNEFKGNLGKTEVPLFRLSMSEKLLRSSISIENGKLRIGEVELSNEIMKIYTDAQKIAFRITANMVDPEFHSDVLPVIESFKEYFRLVLENTGKGLETQAQSVEVMTKRVLELQAEMEREIKNHQALALKQGPLSEKQKNLLLKKYSEESIDRLEKDILLNKNLSEKYEGVTKNIVDSRKMTTRLHWIWARMSMPTPNASRKIKSALNFVKSTFIYEKMKETQQVLDSFSRLQKQGAVIGGAVASTYMGMAYQMELSSFLVQSFDTTKAVLDSIFGDMTVLKDIGYTAKEAIKTTFESFNPLTVKEAYLNQDILPKLGVGLMAMVSSLYVIIGTPHIVVNTVKLYKDLKEKHFNDYYQAAIEKGHGESRAKFESSLKILFNKENFIERQKEEQKKYLDILASAHAKGESTEYSREETEEVEKLIGQLEKEEKANRGFVRKFFSKTNILNYIKKGEEGEKRGQNIDSFGRSFRHFLFSYASFTHTGYIYTSIWNKWFVIRSFALRPSTWYTFLAYPNYYDKIVRPVENINTVIPTKFNGGSIRRFMRTIDKVKVKAWEEKVFTLEEKVHNQSMKKAFVALSIYVKNDDQLRELLENGVIKSIYDNRILQLKKKQQIYFQNVFQLLFNQTMESLLKQINLVSEEKVFDFNNVSDFTYEEIEKLDDIKNIEKTVDEIWDKNQGEIKEQAKGKVKDSFIRPSLRLLRDSSATARVKSTNKHGNNPLRMAQAVRYMIAKNLVDKPMELMFMFVGLAAIQTSGLGQELIRPIQETMFSENSWFYLSRFSFLNGYLMGVVTGIMADVWYKLQVGEMHKHDIGEVPIGEDAKKSFTKWYFKKLGDKENSWWGNQKHYVKLIYANMPAAIVTFMTFNFITLGRFDIDSYLIGYLAAYLLPTSGLNFKLENGFELASGYFFKDIPEKFRSHPLAHEYVGKMAHSKRLAFNFVYTTYENILGMLVFTMNSMETEKLGTRSLTRALFGGWTVTEKIAESAENLKVNLAVSNIPGKDALTKIVDILCKPVTNNFTDWSKFTPKD